MSLGSNGVDRVRSLRKIPTRLRGTNFCTSSERFAPSLERKPSGPKWYETNQNMSLGSNGVDRVPSLQNIQMLLRGTNFCTSSARFPPRFIKQPNCPNCTETHQNMSLGSNGWIGCIRCEQFQCNFVAQTFALVRPVLHRDS